MNNDLAQPEGLSETGKKAYKAIVELLEKNGHTNTGGCKAFYSPKEWEARDEVYGVGSQLIVVYDGGDLRPYFDPDESYETNWVFSDQMLSVLKDVGVYSEACTSWYCAIYER